MAHHQDEPADPVDLAETYQHGIFKPSRLNFSDRSTSYKPLVDEDFREHVRSVSLSTFSTSSSLKRPPPGQGAKATRRDAWWVFDSICLLTSVICMIIIVVLLAIHDGQALESWEFYFSLNTVVSTLGTIGKSTLLAAVSSSLAQGKWLWFKKRRSGLSDFSLLDSASRGPWGSLKLLARADVRHLVSLGAVITILSLGVGPMLQSAIGYPRHLTPFNSSVHAPASISQAQKVDAGFELYHSMIIGKRVDGNQFGSSSSYPDFGIVAAIDNGFAEVTDSQPPFACQSGQCNWPVFASLAVCSSCHDVSNLIKKATGSDPIYYDDVTTAPGNGDLPTRSGNGTMFSIGSGNNTVHINNFDGRTGKRFAEYMTARGFTSPADTLNFQDYQSLLYSVVTMKADDRYANGEGDWQDTSITATECGIYLCVNAYDSSTTNGQLNESVVGTWAEKTPNSWLPSIQPRTVNLKNLSSPILGNPKFSPIGNAMDELLYVNRTDFQLSIPSQFASKLKIKQKLTFNASQSFLVSTGRYLSSLLPSTMGMAIVRDEGEMMYTSSIMQPLYESKNITATFEQLANSMTNRFRSIAQDRSAGTTHEWATFFRIRWGFLILPLGVIIGGCIFMLASIFESRKWKVEPWRADELATLAYGLDERTRTQLRRACVGRNMHSEAAMLRVQLLDGTEGPELR